MTRRHSFTAPVPAVALLFFLVLFSGGCERSEPGGEGGDGYFQAEPQRVEDVHRNNLQGEPTDFLRSRSGDPVHWQGWSPRLLAHAEKEQRLIFALIGSAAFPQTVEVLETFRQRTDLTAHLNEHYVCALADVLAHPELGLQMSQLCEEINRPIAFPVMAWFSHEGNPVAWMPITGSDIESFEKVFGTSRVMVDRIWQDSPSYVIANSGRDAAARRRRLAPADPEEVAPEALRTALNEASRSLAALFDPTSNTVDGGGGLVPAELLSFSARAELSGVLPPSVAAGLGTLNRSVSRTLLASPICDPLDGGFFAGRRSRSWEIPNALKTANTQSLMGIALAQSSTTAKDPRFLDGARDCLDYSARVLAEGLTGVSSYRVVLDRQLADQVFFWSQEQVRDLLPEDEYGVAQATFGLRGLGNVSFEADPRRNYFRRNVLRRVRSIDEVAEKTGRSREEVRQLLNAAAIRLHTHRQELLAKADAVFMERARVTATNATYAAALAQLARVTGNPVHHQRALQVRAAIKAEHRSTDGTLLRFARTEGRRQIMARGEDYAALLSALFSLYRNDLDPAHLADIVALNGEALQQLRDEAGFLQEAPAVDLFTVGPTYSMSMIFGPSTWGLLYGPLERLHQLTGDEGIARTSAAIRDHLTPRSTERPMIHTDFLAASLVSLADTVVYLQGSRGDPGFDALHRILQHPRLDPVTVVHASKGLPAAIRVPAELAPGATVQRGPDRLGTATTPAELERLLSGEGN